MELKEPQSKKRPRGWSSPIQEHPLPIITDSTVIKEKLFTSTGKYNGDCVIVENIEEMSCLNSQGNFGKGSLSRSFPVFGKVHKGIPPFIRERQWKRRCSWASLKTDLDASEDSRSRSRRNVTPKTNDHASDMEGRHVLVLNDSDSECEDDSYLTNLQPHAEQEPCSIREELHLTLEEAFFLSYALGCLRIFDLVGNGLSVAHIWKLFRESQDDFVELYVVYHYFRAKGWVVKPGLKYGGDFLLYKQGPAFYHATYVVKVQVLNWYCTNSRSSKNCLPRWKNVMGLSRLAETAGKELLICQVVWPASCSADDLKSPRIISQFTVNEMLVRRWVASQERSKTDHRR